MTMKRFVFIFAVVLLAGCSASRLTQEEKAAKRAQVAQSVQDKLARRDYRIEVDFMHPQRVPSRHIDYGYELRVHGDSVYSYLPYVGEVRRVPYGGGKGLNFDAVMTGYTSERIKNNGTRIRMIVPNEEDTYLYTVEVMDNGRASVAVYGREHDPISFTGELRYEDKE